jgi:hypothetical protein
MLFRKSLLMLEGVLKDIGGDDEQVHEVLQGQFVRELLREWPSRWVATPNSREFGTHISNMDLCHLMMSGPFTAGRFWIEEGQDLLSAVRGT